MLRIVFFCFTLVSFFGTQAQKLEPAKWDIKLSKNTAVLGEELEIIFRVSVDKDWYVYASDFDPDLGPLLTKVILEGSPKVEKDGDLISVNPSKKHDEVWDGEFSYFKGKGEFNQKIKITGPVNSIKGVIEYQVCTEVDGRCINNRLPFDLKFTLSGG